MYKFTKSGWLSIVSAALISFIGMPLVDAASFTYSLSSNVNANLTGFITTTCDDCVLNASNITSWSMSVPGFFSISSTSPGAQLHVPAGDTDMVATPNAINFNFGGTFGGLVFNTTAAGVGYSDDEGGDIGFGPGEGVVSACKNGGSGLNGCAFVTGESDTQTIALAAVPFVGSVNYTFTGKVTSATGIYATAGTTVTGTLTFDLNAGDGALPVSLTTPWSSISTGAPRVVASTLKSGSVTFSDAGSTSNKTTVAGLATAGSSAPNEYFASDKEFSSPTNSIEHSFQIIGGTGANAPFNSNGLPIFQNATGTGTLLATAGNASVGQLNYTITSLTAVPTTLSVSPASFTFPNTLLNTQSPPLTVTIKNTSPNDVSISGVGLNPDPGNFQITADNCDVVLSPNASCTVSIIFVPFQAGLNQTSFNVTDSAQSSPQVVTLAGTATVAPAPVLTLTTQVLSFASQQVGTTSGAEAITLKNTGNAPLSIYSIAIAGAQADVFTLLNHCVSTLAPGRACTVFVSFTPVATGQASASVVISDNVDSADTGSFQQSVILTGTGKTVPVPGLTLIKTSLSFANQTTGTASVKQAINLINTGTAPLTISSIALAGAQADDFILQNACVPTLAVGRRCAVFVTFKPRTSGEISAAVVVTSDAGGSGSVATLTGTATAATAPVLTVSTTFLSFANQKAGTASTMQAINLTNGGTAPLSLSSIAVVGDGGQQEDFTLRNDCVPVLAPGRHCTLFVTFNPVAAGVFFATLVINDNAQVSQQSVELTGSGL
jgi:hypothetical protein